MAPLSFITDLAWVAGIGASVAALFLWLRQPLILGYLLTGLLLGPHQSLIRVIQSDAHIQLLAQIGVIFLMFFIGLEFNLKRIREIGPSALVAGTLEVALTAWLGFMVGQLFGWTNVQSAFLGAIVCISSTTILVKTLTEMGKVKEDFAGLIVGMLIVEDVVAVAVLVVLSGVATTGSASWSGTLTAFARVIAFSAGAFGLGLAFIPRLMKRITKSGSCEIVSLASFAVCFIYSALAAGMGFSIALGAFISGAVITESGLLPEQTERLSAMRDIFSAIFFITMGMQMNLALLRGNEWLVLAVLAAVVIGKSFACSFSAVVVGADLKTSAKVGLGMSQIGEFSFIIASLGVATLAAPSSLLAVTVAVATLTAFLTPTFIRNGDSLAGRLESIIPSRLKTSLSLYQSWFKAMSWPLRNPKVTRELYPLLARAGFLIAFLICAVAANRWTRAFLDQHAPNGFFRSWDALFIGDLIFGLVYFALFILTLATLRRFFKHLLKTGGEAMDKKGQTLLSMLNFITAVIIGVLFLAFGSPFASPVILLLVLTAVLLTLLGGMGRVFTLVDARFDHLVRDIVDSYGDDGVSSANVRDLMRERYPWEAEMMDFILPLSFNPPDPTLAGLKIRKKTGATVLAVYRGEECWANPAPLFQFQPGDVLMLLGGKEHLEAVSEYLKNVGQAPKPAAKGTAAAPAFRLETVTVPTGSPLSGKSMKDIALRAQTGATVVGLEREGVRQTTLSPDMQIEEGDVLLLIGKPEEVERAKEKVEDAGQAKELLSKNAGING